MNAKTLQRKFSPTLIVVDFHSDHPPISEKPSCRYRIELKFSTVNQKKFSTMNQKKSSGCQACSTIISDYQFLPI